MIEVRPSWIGSERYGYEIVVSHPTRVAKYAVSPRGNHVHFVLSLEVWWVQRHGEQGEWNNWVAPRLLGRARCGVSLMRSWFTDTPDWPGLVACPRCFSDQEAPLCVCPTPRNNVPKPHRCEP